MLAPLQRLFGTSALTALDWAEVLSVSIASDWIARGRAVPGIAASASPRHVSAK